MKNDNIHDYIFYYLNLRKFDKNAFSMLIVIYGIRYKTDKELKRKSIYTEPETQ